MSRRPHAPTLIILAAGLATRFGGSKQVTPVGPSGEAMLEYSVYDAIRAGFSRVIFIIRRDMEQSFSESIAEPLARHVSIELVMQDEFRLGAPADADEKNLRGTAHAVLAAEHLVDAPFAVLNADDFYGRAAFVRAFDALQQNADEQDRYCLLSYRLGNTLSPSGPVSRGICIVQDDVLERVVEHKRLEARGAGAVSLSSTQATSPNEGEFSLDTPVSMNFWGFTPDFMARTRPVVDTWLRSPESPDEVHLPGLVNHLIQNGDVRVDVVPSGSDWFGMTFADDLAAVRDRIAALVEQGEYPAQLWST